MLEGRIYQNAYVTRNIDKTVATCKVAITLRNFT